jgi:hypothetical protein
VFASDKQSRLIPCCLVALAAAVAAPARAATWTPELVVEGRYDDNVLRRSHAVSDFATVARPGLRALYASRIAYMDLRGSRTFISYSRDPQPMVLSDKAYIVATYAPRRHESIGLKYRYDRTLDPLDFEGDELVAQGRTTNLRGDGMADFWRGEAIFRLRDWWYEGAGLPDGDSRAVALRMFPMRNATDLAMVSYKRRDLNLDPTSPLDTHTGGFHTDLATVGWRRWATSRVVAEVEVGAARTGFDDTGEVENDLAVAVGVGRARNLANNIVAGRLRVARDLTTNVLAEAEVVWPTQRLAVRYERLLEFDGTVFRDPTETRRLGVELRGAIDETKRMTLRGSYGRHYPYRGVGTRADIYRVSGAMSMQVLPWMYTRTAYTFYREEFPGGARGTVDRNRISISLNAGAALEDGVPMPGDPFNRWRTPLWSVQ